MSDTDYLSMPSFYLHDIFPCNHNTPELFHHIYGQFKAFYIKDTLYCYISIPKCASQDTQRALWEHPEVDSATPPLLPEKLKEARWFCGHRELHQRLGSAYVSWCTHVKSLGINPIPFQDLLKKPELWDEHIQPQESFLQIFKDMHIEYTTLVVDSEQPELYSRALSNFLNIDITIGK